MRRLYQPRPRTPAEFWERFAEVDHGYETPCWDWQGSVGGGYGSVLYGEDAAQWVVSRLAWTLEVGPIPPGLLVCHHCDNPQCGRPAHLFLGDTRANMRDAAQKGRIWTQATRERFRRREWPSEEDAMETLQRARRARLVGLVHGLSTSFPPKFGSKDGHE